VGSRWTFLACALLAVAARPSRAGEGAGGASAAAPVAGVEPGVVDGATARKLVARGIRVVDVRTPSEFEKGHVPGAVNIPHDQMPDRYAEIGPPSTPVLLYCESGRRTAIAARTLRAQGFSKIYDMKAYDRWKESEPRR
jgi:phage shock protein E